MYILIKNNKIIKTSNTEIVDEWIVVERNPFNLDESTILATWKYNIDNVTWWIFISDEDLLIKLKQEKSEAIQKLASLTDQLNSLARVLMELTKDTENEVIKKERKLYQDIQTILNK